MSALLPLIIFIIPTFTYKKCRTIITLKIKDSHNLARSIRNYEKNNNFDDYISSSIMFSSCYFCPSQYSKIRMKLITVSILQVNIFWGINNLLFVPIIVNFITNKYCIFMRTNLRALYSNVHMHTRSVIQGQRCILHSRFRIKHFICSQCDRNYIFSVLIKIKQQINRLNTLYL